MALKTLSSLVLAPTCALVLAACGGDGSPSSAAPTTAPAPSVEQAPAPAATATSPPASGSPAATGTTPAAKPSEPPSAQEAQPATPPAAPRQETVPATTPEPEPAPASSPRRAPEPEPAGTPIEELAVLSLVERASPREYTQEGTVTGTFDGTMRLEATITNRGVAVRFVATVEGGTIEGKGITQPIITGSPLAEIEGTLAITGGSGRFAAIRGRRLAISGRARLDGRYARVRLAGTVTY